MNNLLLWLRCNRENDPVPPHPPRPVLVPSAPFPHLVLIIVTPKRQRHRQHFEETEEKILGIRELPGLSIVEDLA